MCGIIWLKRLDNLPARKMVAKLYRKQQARGKEGFGFVSFRANKIEKFRKSEEEAPLLTELAETMGSEILFHHRNPTSTPNFWETAHPIRVSNKDLKHDYYVVHNGSVNDTDNKKYHAEHIKAGFVYSTSIKNNWTTMEGNSYFTEEKWNDSEVFAIELVKDLDGWQKGIRHIWGKVAFVCIQTTKEGVPVTLFWGRNSGSPLNIFYHKNFMALTSEGKGSEVPVNNLFSYDYTSGKTNFKGYDVGYHYEYKAADYSHKEWDSDKHNWVDKKNNVGAGYFSRPTLPRPPLLNAGDVDLEKFIEVDNQLKEVKKQLEADMDDEERGYLMNHALSLEGILKDLESKYPTVNKTA